MADFTLTDVATYPNTTSVAAYPVTNWPNARVNEEAAPVGAAASTQTMTSGTLTFTGLTTDVEYVAYALVGSVHQYMHFSPSDVSDTSAVTQGRFNELAARYRTLATQHVLIIDTTTSGLYLSNGAGTIATTTTTNVVFPLIYIDPAEQAITGLNTRFDVRGSVLASATSLGQTLTVGLHQITDSAGAADTISHTVSAAAVTGSTAAVTNPGAGNQGTLTSGDFAISSAGYYAMFVSVPASLTADSRAEVVMQLRVHNV